MTKAHSRALYVFRASATAHSATRSTLPTPLRSLNLLWAVCDPSIQNLLRLGPIPFDCIPHFLHIYGWQKSNGKVLVKITKRCTTEKVPIFVVDKVLTLHLTVPSLVGTF